jgi:hypothetical protein
LQLAADELRDITKPARKAGSVQVRLPEIQRAPDRFRVRCKQLVDGRQHSFERVINMPNTPTPQQQGFSCHGLKDGANWQKTQMPRWFSLACLASARLAAAPELAVTMARSAEFEKANWV